MQMKQTAVLSAVAPSTAITTKESSFQSGTKVVAIANGVTAAFVGSAQWQTSVDGTTWVNQGVAFTGGLVNIQNITLTENVRLNVTAYTSGGIQGTLVSDIS